MGSVINRCDRCGNEYDKTFQIMKDGQEYHFDCFECAIQTLAPACRHCGTRIIGHGIEVETHFYCCSSCAVADGKSGTVDRVRTEMIYY